MRKTKRAARIATAAAALGSTASLVAASPAQAWCEDGSNVVRGGHDDGPVSARLERFTGDWAHGLNCHVVVPAEQIYGWVLDITLRG
jgi:hypothetical protein